MTPLERTAIILAEEIRVARKERDEAVAALRRLLPLARDAQYEYFEDSDGNEDTRTSVVINAEDVLEKAGVKP